jgi:hypothetical protein
VIATVATYTTIICAICFALAYMLACAYFWHDERKRQASLGITEAKQRARYNARHNACTYEATLATVNLKKG